MQPAVVRGAALYINSIIIFPTVETNIGTRAFSVVAPTLWNSLPIGVRSVGNVITFCHYLKTIC